MFKISPLCTIHLSGSSVNNVVLQSALNFNQLLFEFFHVIDATSMHTLMHDAPNLAVNWVQVRVVRWPQISSCEV